MHCFSRPHQARETLKVMMSLQKKNLIEAGDCLGKNIEKASEILKQSSEEVNSLIAKVIKLYLNVPNIRSVC